MNITFADGRSKNGKSSITVKSISFYAEESETTRDCSSDFQRTEIAKKTTYLNENFYRPLDPVLMVGATS
ncbi:MAG: hypothetical protein RIA69_19220 [Cyclobacteriaceae bacterium]